MLVVDLFSGLGGLSGAFLERAHRVIGVDVIRPAEILADVRRLPFREGFRPDVLLGAPPCTEFSRWSFPWFRGRQRARPPSLQLVKAFHAARELLRPRWWCMENVRGAVPFLGPYRLRAGGRHFWGNFPVFWVRPDFVKDTDRFGPDVPLRSRIRSCVEREISLALCLALEKAAA